MNLHPSPRATPLPLGKFFLGAALFLSLGSAARAEQFFLAAEGENVRYGPFDYQEGTPVVIAGKTFVLMKLETAAGDMDMEKKLLSVTLPAIEFREAHVRDVVNFFVEASRSMGPSSPEGKKGVTIVLNLNGKPDSQVPRITFNARHISLLEAIKVLTQVTGLTYRFDGNIVFIEAK